MITCKVVLSASSITLRLCVTVADDAVETVTLTIRHIQVWVHFPAPRPEFQHPKTFQLFLFSICHST